ncbi:MAG TPA: 5'-3' exonuclease H3TH domain-containing protein [Solirubrobacteraceae bacterium]|nr:5'-3' exonuclease H3TH domain-containing protein [Solirubrobacteraceae bacterium]
MPRPLVVVDGPFVLYRSFFALPDSIKGLDDQPVNALLGGANLLLRLIADRDPRAVVVCFGAEAAAYRTELYPPYHAARPPVPDALQWQFDHAEDFFGAFGWSSASDEHFEADDLLGSYATVEAAAGGKTQIMTGDRDMYQCADASTTVVFLKQGSAGFDDVDRDEVIKRYGIPPELVPDFIALRGDPSDGLPGAPGIGAKTAADLLGRHGSLEATLAAADGERPRTAASLKEHADELVAFKDIATLRSVDVERPHDRPTDLDGGAGAADRLGMRRLAERLRAAGSVSDL